MNFKNIGNTCPNTAKIPYNIGENKHHSYGKILNLNRKTKIKPFMASREVTSKKYFLPKTLAVLVAPILLLPFFLISIPFDFPIKYPVGIDPIKYAIIKNKIW